MSACTLRRRSEILQGLELCCITADRAACSNVRVVCRMACGFYLPGRHKRTRAAQATAQIRPPCVPSLSFLQPCCLSSRMGPRRSDVRSLSPPCQTPSSRKPIFHGRQSLAMPTVSHIEVGRRIHQDLVPGQRMISTTYKSRKASKEKKRTRREDY